MDHVFVWVRFFGDFFKKYKFIYVFFIGQRFALTQGKSAIVELVKNFNIKPNPKTRSDNLLDKKEFITRLDGGVWLNFESRN